MFGGSQMRIIHWRKGFFCVAMLVRATTGLARAEDHAAGFQTLTPGSRPSCGSYTTERTFPTRGQQLQYWALGFLSGVNISGSAGTDFLEPIDGQAVWAWLDMSFRAPSKRLFGSWSPDGPSTNSGEQKWASEPSRHPCKAIHYDKALD